jgi:hypothetical protein
VACGETTSSVVFCGRGGRWFRLAWPGCPTTRPAGLRVCVAVPAFIVGPGQDVLAGNALAHAVYSGFSRFDNLLRMIFFDPFARCFYLDWDQAARTAVRNLRARSIEAVERTEQLVGALSVRSPVFSQLWASHDVGPRTTETKRFLHPEVGELILHFEALTIASAPGQHLSVYIADPESSTAVALRRLELRTTQQQELVLQR